MTAAGTRAFWVEQAEHLATSIAAHVPGVVAQVAAKDSHVKSPYLTVRWTGERYPVETVWVDQDGYTWGTNFQHRLWADTPPDVVAAAVIDTLLPRGTR